MLAKLFDLSPLGDKAGLLIHCVKKIFFDLPSDSEAASLQERSLDLLIDVYKNGQQTVEIKNLFVDVVCSSVVSDKMRKKAFDLFYGSCAQADQRSFFADTLEHLMAEDTSGELIHFALVRRFFNVELTDDLIDKAKYCVDFLWKYRKCDGFTKYKDVFLATISTCGKTDLIEYTLRKGW